MDQDPFLSDFSPSWELITIKSSLPHLLGRYPTHSKLDRICRSLVCIICNQRDTYVSYRTFLSTESNASQIDLLIVRMETIQRIARLKLWWKNESLFITSASNTSVLWAGASETPTWHLPFCRSGWRKFSSQRTLPIHLIGQPTNYDGRP